MNPDPSRGPFSPQLTPLYPELRPHQLLTLSVLSSRLHLNPQGLLSADSQTRCPWEGTQQFLNLVRHLRDQPGPFLSHLRPGKRHSVCRADRNAQGNATLLASTQSGHGGHSCRQQDSKERALHCGEEWFCSSPQISVKQTISVTTILILTLL